MAAYKDVSVDAAIRSVVSETGRFFFIDSRAKNGTEGFSQMKIV